MPPADADAVPPKHLSCPTHGAVWGTIYKDGAVDYDCGCHSDAPADATPAPSPLEALLSDADAPSVKGSAAWLVARAAAAPRLAAIVRVLREAMTFYASGDRNAFRCESERLDPAKGTGPCCERVIDAGGIAADALRRADEIAEGK